MNVTMIVVPLLYPSVIGPPLAGIDYFADLNVFHLKLKMKLTLIASIILPSPVKKERPV